jgi:D-3-phosphoglycerate dehydrogenase
MSKIAITDYIDNPDLEIEVLGDLVGNEVAEETEVLLVWHDKIDHAYIKNLPNLRAVQRYGVGFDNLDLSLLKERNIIACNNPDYGVDEVSDTTLAMILNITRGISKYNHAAKRFRSTWQENVDASIRRHSDMVVGIIGAGRIGGSLALKCHALGFKVVFYDPFVERGYEKMIRAKRVDDLHELLQASDVVSVNVPLSDDTKGLINDDFIKAMKSGASLVNTARGGLIDNLDAVYDALLANHINCFATDVLPDEPPVDSKLINAWRNNDEALAGRIIINPHTSYFSQQSVKELRLNAAKNALRLYKGEAPYNRLV